MTLALMHDVTRRGIASIVFYARAGYFTLPASVLDDYTALETLAAQYETDPQQSTADEAAAVTAGIVDATRGGSADALITGHLQPALAAFLDDFTANVATAGAYAALDEPPVDLLAEPDAVQAAYKDITESATRWNQIRTGWRILRGLSLAATYDPGGVDSIHAEVANTLAMRPLWDPNSPSGRLASPWGGNAFHVRLKWLTEHDAQVWAPTATQQSLAWRDNNPELDTGL